MIEIKEVQSGFYVNWSEVPQNIPVNGSYFECPNCIVFDNTKFEEEKEDGEN